MLCAYIHMTVHDGRGIEAERLTGLITGGIVIAVVEFMRDIECIVGVEDLRSIRSVPAFRNQHPDDAVFHPVGRNCGSGCIVLKGVVIGGFEREFAVLYFEVAQMIAAALDIDIVIPVGHRTIYSALERNDLEGVAVVRRLIVAHMVAVHYVDGCVFSSDEGEMRVRSRLIGQKKWSA